MDHRMPSDPPITVDDLGPGNRLGAGAGRR